MSAKKPQPLADAVATGDAVESAAGAVRGGLAALTASTER